MGTLLRCPRQHFWQNEVGLRKETSGLALRVGSAWARAMEARWRGADYMTALIAAVPEGIDLDAYACETVAALLAAYYEYWGERETVGALNPEVQFQFQLDGTEFTSEGKMDGLGSLTDGRSVIVEAKTTSDAIDANSDFWLRLKFNMQVWQYVSAARRLGWDVQEVYYDVTRKPGIRPKVVDDLDSNGKKIVVDKNGTRIYIQAGKNKGEPRQTGDAKLGLVVKSHRETPEEFGERLYKDVKSRPEFYFVRKSVPIIDQEVEAFERQRLALARLIAHYRSTEESLDHSEGFERDPEAWPRACSENTCSFCSYKSFCLQNISVDLNQPPPGFAVLPFNPELNEHDDSTTTEAESAAAA